MSSIKSSDNIQKKECAPDSIVSKKQFSSVTLNVLAIEAKESIFIIISSINKTIDPKTDINPNGVQIEKHVKNMSPSL